jgi:predicted ATP-grasp superfamily ATP-dependent carboligase
MTTPTNGAVVIGRDYGALGVIRSLGRNGIPVLLLEPSRSNAGVSRHLWRRRGWPGECEEAEQLAVLRALARDGCAGWSIFPTSDESAALIARHHAELNTRFILTTPPWEIYRLAYDKRLTYQLAATLGIAAPVTVCPRDESDLAGRDWRFPVILKPAFKPRSNRLTAEKAWRVDDLPALLARYAEVRALGEADSIMVQEFIPGNGSAQFSFVALCEDGRPVAWGTARRARQFPLDFGKFSTFVESVDCPEIEAPSRALLAAMRYTGVVEIEYKRDPRTGELKLLDINARYWAWHSLGRRAGVDFPMLQWRAVHGEVIPSARMRSGVRWVRGSTDLLAALSGIRQSTLSPLTYVASLRPPLAPAVFALDDPLPFFADVPLLVLRRGAPWPRGIRGQITSHNGQTRRSSES